MSRRAAKFLDKFDVTVPGDGVTPRIIGSDFLHDSRLLLLDRDNKKLKLFDSTFNFIIHKHLNGVPYGLSVYDSEIAVAEECNIVLFSVESDIKEKTTLQFEGECGDVAHINRDKFVVTGLDRKEQDVFCVYTSTGNQLSSLDLGQNGKKPLHVTLDREKTRAYVATYCNNIVSAIDIETNRIVFTYKHEDLRLPRGLTVDQENKLYVCGSGSQNIHQVSPQGFFTRVLLSSSDNLIKPWTIAFSPDGIKFVVAGFSDFAQVYTVK